MKSSGFQMTNGGRPQPVELSFEYIAVHVILTSFFCVCQQTVQGDWLPAEAEKSHNKHLCMTEPLSYSVMHHS